MPIVYLTETQAREAGITQVFKTVLAKAEHNQKSLAKKIGMKYSTLHKRIHMPETATLGKLWKIIDSLGLLRRKIKDCEVRKMHKQTIQRRTVLDSHTI